MRRRTAGVVSGVGLAAALVATCPSPEPVDPYRPVVHFAPAANWINDPNGPVWYEGRYHLFFQHNPEGDQWGNMSWGHAVSDDLVHWEERPVAIPYADGEHVFSGTVVVDEQNTSGFGTDGRAPLVAVYTSHDPGTGVQAQSLAYSTDGGDTWRRHGGNPVLDIGSREFRDPKVFWYDEGGYWVMAVVLATERVMQLYRSPDLRTWEHLSDFGPANAVGGVWEMPDLFELPVDGDLTDTRWVLVMSLNPGGVAGGSGTQYFVGHFDGTRFTAENVVDGDVLPAGEVVAGFDGPAYGPGWRSTGTAFGTGPATGTLPGQHDVSGSHGTGLVNSFLGGDRSTGTLTSPAFTLERDHLALLVGGGRHPASADAGDGGPPPGHVLADFEGADFGAWTVTGTAFGPGPTAGDAECQEGVVGHLGERLANSYRNGHADPCSPPPDSATGTLSSLSFTVAEPYISFLVGGGPEPSTAVRLLVDGEVVRSTSGSASGVLDWASWDVTDLIGREARIEVHDGSTEGWGHIMVDHVVMGPEPAEPRPSRATVDLVVDGEVVRSATGADSEVLDWVSWDVSGLRGRSARLHVVDHATGPWGHVLVDHVVLTDDPVGRRIERYAWQDHGSDFYAPLTFENLPDGERVAIAWMSNWSYAGATPTVGWRGAMTLPRRLELRTIEGEVRLVQQPAVDLADVRRGPPVVVRDLVVGEGRPATLERAAGNALLLEVDLEIGSADEVGLRLRAGDAERTVVGYDARTGRLFVDREASGTSTVHPDFPARHSAPFAPVEGRVRFTVVLDRSSVEVFSADGTVTITDLVYPAPTSDAVVAYAEGGRAVVRSLTVHRLARR